MVYLTYQGWRMIRRVTVSKQLVTRELYVGHSLVPPSSSVASGEKKKYVKISIYTAKSPFRMLVSTWLRQ